MATVRNSDNLAADTKADEEGRERNSEGGNLEWVSIQKGEKAE